MPAMLSRAAPSCSAAPPKVRVGAASSSHSIGLPKATAAKLSRASGGNRTHNPRITNAVLCQLKLRWRGHPAGKRRTAESFKLAQRLTERQVAPFYKGFLDTPCNKKSGVSTRQERPTIVKRVRGKATARPKKAEDPTFLRCG